MDIYLSMPHTGSTFVKTAVFAGHRRPLAADIDLPEDFCTDVPYPTPDPEKDKTLRLRDNTPSHYTVRQFRYTATSPQL